MLNITKNKVQNASSQKNLGLVLDEKLNFESHCVQSVQSLKVCKI